MVSEMRSWSSESEKSIFVMVARVGKEDVERAESGKQKVESQMPVEIEEGFLTASTPFGMTD
jgi:hypothetical protein